MADRQPCVIPGCGRTRPADGRFAWWICARHYALGDRRLKALRRAALRRHRVDLADRLISRIRARIERDLRGF